MKSSRHVLRALSALLPLGALGVSVALAAAPAKPITSPEEATGSKTNVAARLQAIRSAVSEITAEQSGLQQGDPNIAKAWWGNGGWGNGGWRNGGWRNAPWGNWHNGWGNGGWHNWHNFWRNW